MQSKLRRRWVNSLDAPRSSLNFYTALVSLALKRLIHGIHQCNLWNIGTSSLPQTECRKTPSWLSTQLNILLKIYQIAWKTEITREINITIETIVRKPSLSRFSISPEDIFSQTETSKICSPPSPSPCSISSSAKLRRCLTTILIFEEKSKNRPKRETLPRWECRAEHFTRASSIAGCLPRQDKTRDSRALDEGENDPEFQPWILERASQMPGDVDDTFDGSVDCACTHDIPTQESTPRWAK